MAGSSIVPGSGAEPSVRELAQRFGVTLTLAEHLRRIGQAGGEGTQKFLDPKLRDLTPPDKMAGRAEAARRIARAIERRESIVVFGDYDCDGITSTAILSEVIEELGGVVTPLLASRFGGGYGVSKDALERIFKAGPLLLVTCDCGSSDHATLREVVARGVDVVVIDHHLVPEEKLPALAFLNPHRPECGFPYKGLASCGLALSIAAALRAELGRELDVRRWLDLVAIGSVADVAPLDGDNRALVRAGLKLLSEAQRPGVRALLEVASLEIGKPLTAEDIAFRIAPRLNAPGRLGAPDLSLSLLRARTLDEARGIAAQVEQLCTLRREQQNTMIEEALADVRSEGLGDRAGLVLGRRGWNHGIVGIVAGRLADDLKKPVAVIGFEGDVGRGSLRGPPGARLFDALERVGDVLVRFGGHQAAAGLEVKFERLAELRARFEESCRALEFEREESELPPLLLAAGEDPSVVLRDLYRLEPCGEKNPAPTLAIEGELLIVREVKGGHLKLELLLEGGRRLGGFGPNLGARVGEIDALSRSNGRVRAIGSLRHDRFRGGEAVEILVRKVELAV